MFCDAGLDFSRPVPFREMRLRVPEARQKGTIREREGIISIATAVMCHGFAIGSILSLSARPYMSVLDSDLA